MSNKTYAWLCSSLIVAVCLVALILSHLDAIGSAWLWIRWLLAVIAVVLALYALYLAWHQVSTRHLDRSHKKEKVKQLRASYEDEKWRADQTLLHTQEMERERLRIEQMRLTLDHERLMAASIILNTGQTVVFPGDSYRAVASAHAVRQIGTTAIAEEVDEMAIPVAPRFLDMCHLITSKQAPLCFSNKGPEYGTVADLLSMAVSGKPGRGKTTALMYYVAILLQAGAEVWIFDPHGAMGELAKLNGRVLANMPATAKVVYLDRQQDIAAAVQPLMRELDARDEYYRPAHAVKHPMLLLADELPVLADWDIDIIADWKANKKDGHAPSMARLIKKFVLEARKWNCYFIGSGQTFDADTLPTKVTENLNSRIVFFSSDRRARMSGLETDAIKTLLPAIRRAGSGVMIFDCSRFDGPIMGALPMITVEDLMVYLGVKVIDSTRHTGELAGTPGTLAIEPPHVTLRESHKWTIDALQTAENDTDAHLSGVPHTPLQGPVDTSGAIPDWSPGDLQFDATEEQIFKAHFLARGSINNALRAMGKGNRYQKHASFIVRSHGLKKEVR